jgi:hypothetical protein
MTRWAFGLLLLGALLALPSAAAACSGTALAGQDTTDPDAAVIFTGTAVRREDPGPFRLGGNLFDPVRWTFVVDGVQKGSADRRMTVESERADGSCGFVFQLGQRYRVVVSDFGHGPQVWLNSGTSLLEPLAAPPAIEGEGFGVSPWIAALFGVAALVSVVAFVRRPALRRAAR